MSAHVTQVQRRTFGVPRLVYIVRCPTCAWRAETSDGAVAVNLAKAHVCPSGGAAA